MRVSAKGLEYPNKYYWDKAITPYGDITNGLADCTCYAYGAVIEEGHRPVVSKLCNADSFHKYLINGWSYVPYNPAKLEPGDIIEWSSKCHVAVYTGGNLISGSFYTGDHGRAYYNGKFDTRSFTSLQQMSDWMIKNYPTRFFHHWDIDTENRWVNGTPDYILKHPLYSVPQNTSVNQIQVLADDMNVRNDNNDILCRAEKGFYNVLGWKDSNGYRWYEVEPGKYIANVASRVIYIPCEDSIIEELKAENERLRNLLKEINSLSDI